MEFIKKLDLNRFKRSMQGLIDFAMLIEQADPANRAKIIEQAEQQDSEFVFKVMRKVVFFEELIYLDEAIQAEIFAKTTSKVLAYALIGAPEELRNAVMKQMGHRERKLLKEEEEKMGDHPPSSLALGAQKQILKTARQLEAQMKFTFELTTCPRFKLKKKRTFDNPPNATVEMARPVFGKK